MLRQHHLELYLMSIRQDLQVQQGQLDLRTVSCYQLVLLEVAHQLAGRLLHWRTRVKSLTNVPEAGALFQTNNRPIKVNSPHQQLETYHTLIFRYCSSNLTIYDTFT